MNYRHPQLIDELAAQYVLGTLRGAARRRFERFYRADPAALTAVRRWEDRLVSLVADVPAVQPPASIWKQVRLRTRRERKPAARNWSFPQFAIAAGVTALAIVLTWWNWLGPGSMQLVATVADQQHAEVWRIEAPTGRRELRVAATATFAFDETRAYELWALPGAGAAPVSLGLMPQRGHRTLQLSEAQRSALERSKQMAVSLEPPGGSPTGAPTGPILFAAEILAPS